VAYFAGGCVRDRLLNKAPKDYDIATNARPDQVRALFGRTALVGAHFGVVLVKEPEGDFDVATFRTDGSYADGRRPDSVTFATAEEDAQRRDFTINGLFEDPIAERVIDFVGGEADLRDRVVRAIGDPAARFQEDYLRLLRAVRIAATLDFEIEPATFEAIRQTAPRIDRISPERIREELVKILLPPNRLRGFDLLVDSGLMDVILPEITALKGCQQPPQYHPEGDVFVHTRLMLSLLGENASLPLILSVLFHDIGKPVTYSYDEAAGRIRFNNHDKVGARMTEEILRRLRFSNEVIRATVDAVDVHMGFKDVRHMRTSRLKRFMAREHFDDELELHRIDCLGSNGRLDNYEFVQAKRVEFSQRGPLIPRPLVTGRDLLQLGYPSGPKLGEILEAIQVMQLENQLANHEEAMSWVRANHPLGSAENA